MTQQNTKSKKSIQFSSQMGMWGAIILVGLVVIVGFIFLSQERTVQRGSQERKVSEAVIDNYKDINKVSKIVDGLVENDAIQDSIIATEKKKGAARSKAIKAIRSEVEDIKNEVKINTKNSGYFWNQIDTLKEHVADSVIHNY